MTSTVAALLLALVAAALAGGADSATANMPAICTDEPGCKCNRTASGFWVQVSCSCTPEQSMLQIKPEQLPTELLTLEISRCKEVRLLAGSLTQQKAIRKIHTHDLDTLILKRNSFLNATATNTLLHIENCSTVVIESAAYKNTLSPQSIVLEQAKHVVIQPSAFSWIQDFSFKQISRLELHKNAFSQSGAAVGHHGPATKVSIEDSMIPEVPGLAFPLSAAELRIERSAISVIRKDAFCGLLVLNLLLEQCKLDTVERGAFSARTLVHRLSLSNLTVETVTSNAVQSAVANFTLQHSKLREVQEGGINVTAATVLLLNNVIQRLNSRGLAFSQWDRLEIQSNVFKDMGFSGVWAPTERSDSVVVFAENVIGRMASEGGVLHFGISPRANTADIQVQDNRFERQCTCRQWLREEVSPRRGELLPSDYAHKWTDFWVDAFHNNSMCVVSDLLAKCFGSNTSMGFMRMTSFWDSVCVARTVIRCQNGDIVDIPDDVPQPPTLLRNAATVAWILIGLVGICVILIVLINNARDCYKRYPDHRLSVSKVLPCLKRTEAAETETPTLPIGTEVSTSIDLLPGARKQRRKKRHKRRDVGVTASEDNTLMIDEVAPGSTNCSEAGTVRTQASTLESTIMVMDSGTQTMGSGTLVDDILSDLKEKLKDPTAYGATREMIENIYNQISTTESTQRPAAREENTYAEIQPCTSYQNPAVCEYGEPKDRRNNIYTEPQTRFGRIYQFIRGSPQNKDVEASPATVTDYMDPSDTKVHTYTELQQPSKMAGRPLPRTPEELSSEDDSESEESS